MRYKTNLTILLLIVFGGYSAYAQNTDKTKSKRGSVNPSLLFSGPKTGNSLIDSTITIKNKPITRGNLVRYDNSDWFRNRRDSIMGNTRKLDVVRSTGNELILRDSTRIIYKKQ